MANFWETGSHMVARVAAEPLGEEPAEANTPADSSPGENFWEAGSRMVAEGPKATPAPTPTWEVEGAPAAIRAAVGASEKPEDALATLKQIDPNAQQILDSRGDTNYVYTDPTTGKKTLYNDVGIVPSAGDIASIIPEIGEIVGGTLGALGAGSAGAAEAMTGVGLPAAAVTWGAVPLAAGAGATAGREAAQRAAQYLFGTVDTRTPGEQLKDAALTFGINTGGELLGPVLGAAGRALPEPVRNAGAAIASGAKKAVSFPAQAVRSLLPESAAAATRRTEGEVARLIAQGAGRTPEEVAAQLNPDLTDQGLKALGLILPEGPPVSVAGQLDSPALAATERNFLNANENFRATRGQAIRESAENAFSVNGPQGDIYEPALALGEQKAAADAALREAIARREAAQEIARQEGTARVNAAMADAADTLGEARTAAAARLADQATQAAEAAAAQKAAQAEALSAGREAARTAVTPRLDIPEASAAAHQLGMENFAAAKARAGAKYNAVPQVTDLSADPIREAVAAVATDAQQNGLQHALPDSALKELQRRGHLGGLQDSAKLQGARKLLNQEIISAAGDPTKQRYLYMLKDGITEALGTSANPEYATSLEAANAAYRQLVGQPFKEGAAKQAFGRMTFGQTAVSPTKFLNTFIKPDTAGGQEAAQQLMKVLGDSDEGAQIASDYVMGKLGRAAQAGDGVSLPSLLRFRNNYSAAIEAIPGLSAKVDAAEAAARTLNGIAPAQLAERTALNKELAAARKGIEEYNKAQIAEAAKQGAEAVAEAKAEAKVLLASASNTAMEDAAKAVTKDFDVAIAKKILNQDPISVANGLLSSPTWERDLRYIKNKLEGHPAALRGFERSLYEASFKKMEGAFFGAPGVAEKTMDAIYPRLIEGLGPVNAARFKELAEYYRRAGMSFRAQGRGIREALSPDDARLAIAKVIRRGGGMRAVTAIQMLFGITGNRYIGASSAGGIIGMLMGGPFAGIAGAALGAAYEWKLAHMQAQVMEMFGEALFDPRLAKDIFDRVLTRKNAPTVLKSVLTAYNRGLITAKPIARRAYQSYVDDNQRKQYTTQANSGNP